MNEAQLLQRRAQAETLFNAVQKELEVAQAKVAEHNDELNRLRGEYRLINELLEQLPVSQNTEKKGKSKISPAANVIDAAAALKEKK